MTTAIRAALFGSAALAATSLAHAQSAQIDGLVVFGDSLSDSGQANSTSTLTGGANPFADFGYANGQFSDGPVWSSQLAARLGVPESNFAFGGARAIDNGDFIPDLAAQIDLFTAQDGAIGPNELATVWIGANDLFAGIDPGDPLGFETAIGGSLQEIGTALTRLSALGAETVVLVNIPSLGVTPLLQGQAALLGDPSPVVGGNQVAGIFNASLSGTVASVEAATGLNVISIDVDGLLQSVLANPGQFGFTNTTDACVNSLGSPGSGLPGLPDGPTGACPNGDSSGFVFFDLIHPTAQNSAVVAAYVDAGLRSVLDGARQVAVQSQVAQFGLETAQRAIDARLFARRFGVVSGDRHGDGTDEARNQGLYGVKGLAPYLMVNYAQSDRDPQANIAGYEADALAITAGIDWQGEHVTIGGAFSYVTADGELDLGGDVDVESYVTTFYSSFDWRCLYGDASVGISVDEHDTNRATGFDPSPIASAEANGSQRFATFALGYRKELSERFFIGPQMQILFRDTEIDAYSENAFDTLGLDVRDQDVESLRWRSGAIASALLNWGPLRAAQVRVGYERELDGDGSPINLTTFGETVAGSTELDEEGSVVSAIALGLGLNENLQGLVDYQNRFVFGDGTDHSILARLRYAF